MDQRHRLNSHYQSPQPPSGVVTIKPGREFLFYSTLNKRLFQSAERSTEKDVTRPFRQSLQSLFNSRSPAESLIIAHKDTLTWMRLLGACPSSLRFISSSLPESNAFTYQSLYQSTNQKRENFQVGHRKSVWRAWGTMWVIVTHIFMGAGEISHTM